MGFTWSTSGSSHSRPIVLIPGSQLGLLTEAVQALAGELLASATVFLLALCDDKAVLGPWVNSKKLNLFTGSVIWVLVMLSIILTASVMYPVIKSETIIDVLVGCTAFAVGGYIATVLLRRASAKAPVPQGPVDRRAAPHLTHAVAWHARAAENEAYDAGLDGRAARRSGDRGRSRDLQGAADDAV